MRIVGNQDGATFRCTSKSATLMQPDHLSDIYEDDQFCEEMPKAL
jgi:hypothetical protein